MTEYQQDAYDIFSNLDFEVGRLEKLHESHALALARHADAVAEQEARVRGAEAAAVAVMEFNEVTRCTRGDTIYTLERVPYTDTKRITARSKALVPEVWSLKVPDASGPDSPASPAEEATVPA